MTPAIAIGLALAVAASLALNTGFMLQHSGASQAPASLGGTPVRMISSQALARSFAHQTALDFSAACGCRSSMG